MAVCCVRTTYDCVLGGSRIEDNAFCELQEQFRQSKTWVILEAPRMRRDDNRDEGALHNHDAFSYSLLRIDPQVKHTFLDDRVYSQDSKPMSKWSVDVESGTLTTRVFNRRTDYCSTIGAVQLWSQKARDCVDRFQLPDGARWVAIEVKARFRRPFRYWVLALPEMVDVLDFDASDYTWLVTGKLLGTIRRWVLCRERIPAADIFIGNNHEWLVSAPLRTALEDSGFTGGEFQRVEFSEPSA